jgi:CBS domain-containing protein
MRAADVMSKGVVTVSPDTTAEDALQAMRAQRIHHLLVGSVSQPVGILSARDVGGRSSATSRRRPVRELMAAPIVTVDAAEVIRRVANVMRGRSIGCVVVTARGRVVGIITISDLLELLGRGSDKPLSTSDRRGLHHRVPHRRAATPSGLW